MYGMELKNLQMLAASREKESTIDASFESPWPESKGSFSWQALSGEDPGGI